MVKFWVILNIAYSKGNITFTWWQKWNRCSFNTPESRDWKPLWEQLQQLILRQFAQS